MQYLAPVVRRTLEKSYGNTFEEVVLRKYPEPWNPLRVMKCLEHFSYAGFAGHVRGRGLEEIAKAASDEYSGLISEGKKMFRSHTASTIGKNSL